MPSTVSYEYPALDQKLAENMKSQQTCVLYALCYTLDSYNKVSDRKKMLLRKSPGRKNTSFIKWKRLMLKVSILVVFKLSRPGRRRGWSRCLRGGRHGKTSQCKWTREVQTPVVQGSTVIPSSVILLKW